MKQKRWKSFFMMGVLILGILFPVPGNSLVALADKTENLTLYARSAVLMDGASGRVLYEKNGSEVMPMASTTKIMTCILALELAQPDDIVTISKYASTMPDVQLNIREGERYKLKELLYSLMLESHNDSAVAIAEQIGGSVEGFAKLMNDKAQKIGCTNTHFVTPNGLDKEDEGGAHSTTASDLATIMRYCIVQSPKKDEFLEITQTPSYRFSDMDGKRSFSCSNHNAFLNMMAGALSGKTGFTSAAGYCYVGALEREGKTLIVALLACGWPNNKTYKWSDTKKLMNYGLENYEYKSLAEIKPDLKKLKPIMVIKGQTENMGEIAMIPVEIEKVSELTGGEVEGLLLAKDEEIKVSYRIEKTLEAPVKAGTKVGYIHYSLGDKVWKEYLIITSGTVKRIDYRWCFIKVFDLFIMG